MLKHNPGEGIYKFWLKFLSWVLRIPGFYIKISVKHIPLFHILSIALTFVSFPGS